MEAAFSATPGRRARPERCLRGGTGGMRALWAALAAVGLCGLAAAAPLGTAAGGAVPASDGAEASMPRFGAEETPAIQPAELAAAPAGTRAVLEQVLDRMELMRAEIAELRADKAGVAALAAARRRGEAGEDVRGAARGGEATAQARDPTEAEPSRRRAQAGQACARVQDFQVLTAAAMDAWPARRQREAAGTGARCRPAATCRLPARRRRARRCSCRSWRTATRC